MTDSAVLQVAAAFMAVQAMNDVDRGIAQHTLMVALKRPRLSMAADLAAQIAQLPQALRDEAKHGPPKVVSLTLAGLMLVAHEDERFLQNFLEGRPACPMFSDDDLSTF